MEKKCPSFPVTHSHAFGATYRDTLHDKGTVKELWGRLHSRCSKIIPVNSGTGDNICTRMFTPPYPAPAWTGALPQVE